MMSISVRITRTRMSLGLSRAKYATHINQHIPDRHKVDRNRLARIESGRCLPNSAELHAIAVASGVSVHWLMHGQDTKATLDQIHALTHNTPGAQHAIQLISDLILSAINDERP